MNKKEQILNLVAEYIEEKHANKKWEAGKDWVQYSGHFFDHEEYVAAVETLLNEWLVLGQDALEFERTFPKLLGKEYGLLTNSGSSANLLMMLLAREYGRRKVIVPVAGFPTTVNPILQVGLEPIFVDIEIDSLNINIDQLERAAKDNPDSALTFAHVLGNPPNMDAIMEIVKRYNLLFLEDTCDGLGSTYNNKPLGSFGTVSSVSFYPAHHITMGEGGFVACNNIPAERLMRRYREWGRACYCTGKEANLLKNGTCKKRFSNWLPNLPKAIFDHKYVYESIGYNLKPIEIQASIGLAQMKKLPKIKEKRIDNYNTLMKIFSPYEKFFHLPRSTEQSNPSWFAFPLTIRDNVKFTRSDICMFLEEKKIQTRQYFGGNLLLQPAYQQQYLKYKRDNWKDPATEFSVATKVTTDTFFLGTSPVITKEQYRWIAVCVDKFMENHNK